MGGKSATLTQRDTRLSNIRVQTSSQGLVIPKGWGRYRVGCNLVWYGNFRAIEHKSVEEQGGKGGGGGVKSVTITYTYEAAIMVVLGHGVGNGVVSAWKGKERLMGTVVPATAKTVSHTFDLPDLGGDHTHFFLNGNSGPASFVVTVPDAGTFMAPVRVFLATGKRFGLLGRQRTELNEGVHFTRSGGTYTFNSNAPAGRYTIEYQVQDAAATMLSALGQLNMSFQPGLLTQPVWPWLQANYPDQALAYPGLMLAYSQAYSLTDAAELYNHNFEVSTPSELGMLPGRTSPVFDADPRVIVEEVVTNDSWAAGWYVGHIDGLDRYSDYCIANGFWLSPVLEEQASAAVHLENLLQLTNTNVVWDGEVLTFVPLGDADVTGNGRTYVADTTPIVDLDFDHLQAGDGEAPLKIRRHYGQDGSSELAEGDDVGYNVWTLEIENRDNGYNTEPVSYEETAHILLHGRRQKDTIKAKAIKVPSVGLSIATLLCQRELGARNVYEFKVPWTMGFLRPLHLVTLTDTTFNLFRAPVRVLTVEEEDDQFTVTAEDCDIGQASAPAYGTQAGQGYQQDYGVSPGMVDAPVIFEPPAELAPGTGLALWAAVSGTDPFWGGAEVWCSLDEGVTYKRMGVANGGARYGALASALGAGAGEVLDVQLSGRGGTILGATAEDAAALATLVYVRAAGGAPEFLAYEGATLTAPKRYALDGLTRGIYGTTALTRPVGSPVVRVDELLVRGEPIPLSMIGKAVRFKFLSFNVFGSGKQSLEDVPEYTYTIAGDMVRLPPTDVASISYALEEFGVRLRWPEIADGDRDVYVLRVGGASWEAATELTSKAATSHLWTVQAAGTWRVWIKAKDTLGNLSLHATYVDVVIPAPTSSALEASIEGPDIVLTWSAAAGAFALSRYELRHGDDWEGGAFIASPLSSSYREKVLFTGPRRYWVVAIDAAGNVSAPTALDVVITAPGAVQQVRAEVVDNNALLYWAPPLVGTLPVDRYEVRKGASFEAGVVVGSNGNSTFTTIFEQQAGVYQYWVAPVDTAEAYGPAVAITATILQPPDYVLRADLNSDFTGVMSNMLLDGGVLYGPVNTVETWSEHFQDHGWLTPQDQVDAGLPLYINPSLTTGTYVETVDYGTELPSTFVTITPGYTVVQGTVAVAVQVAYKLDAGDPWTVADAGATQVLVPAFRYLRVTLTVTAAAGANLVAVTTLNVKLANKLRTDSGRGAAVATDVGGTPVAFNLDFIDADLPIAQPAGTAPRFAVIDFVDAPNPTGFKVLLFDRDGNRVSGDFSWTVRGITRGY